jgi:hypothetical protein
LLEQVVVWFSVGSSVKINRERKWRGAVIESGAWFGMHSRYWRQKERERAVVRTNRYWI